MKQTQALLAILLAMASCMSFAKDEEKKWDIDNPTDQTFSFELDTTEGTWLSLDVSPDGKSIVFDLLGDIYWMPISGGDAKALTQGLAWDMQPRFSPDGKRIAFTSDRGAGDNIWTMNLDGEDMQQVSKESFRLLNSPAWSPDGEYIAARKHFSSTRSLGSGEIWLYHHTGGKGLQLNEKPNLQKDLGEPAFSHDGRYVYFSQDTTPGGTFEYNKDPSPGIYSIKRIDRQTGEIETVISAAGGSIRPTPSPDGKHLAYVGRHDYQTKLFVMDLESRQSRIVYHDLERDLQETWAVHGVYPTMAWTPDSKDLVFWAKGKIHRLNLESGKANEVPFRVRNTHTMVKTVRHKVEVAPDEFEVRMLRWVNTSPDGKQVIYTALGHIYIKDLPNGKVRRLTKGDAFEYFPQFSRDGKQIAFVSWTDETQGTVMVVSSKGGQPRALTKAPGHYTNPSFSPDGKHVVYTKFDGGFITSGLYAKDSGIYLTATSGDAEPLRISKRGSQPHFASENDRVFFVTVDKDMVRTLRSVDTMGKESRDHADAKQALEMRVSPNGKWLAFTEDFNAHITPFIWSSQKYRVGPKMTSAPVKRVSKYAAEYLNWSGDSQTLYWAMGPELYSRDLKDSFAFLDGAPETLPEAADKGTYIGFKQKTDVPDGMVAFVGARIITMKGDEVIEEGTVLVKGNRIHKIGAVDAVKVPKSAMVIDAKGKTIIPGLVDVHAHARYGTGEIVPQQNWNTNANLALGVTTTHDPSSDTTTVFAASEMAKAGLIDAPRTYSTGTILYGAMIPGYTAKIDNLEEARSHLLRLKAVGAFSVKSYNQPRRDQRQQVLKAAREETMMVVPEGGSLYQHNMSMIADGHTGVEHSIPMAVLYDDVVQFWGKTETGYTPTMGVAYGGLGGEYYWYQHTNVWEHPILSQHVPEYVLNSRSRRRLKSPEMEYNHIRVAEGCKKMLDAGVTVQLGAHGQREGLAAHWELWMFAQGGMTPLEVLRCGTLNGAIYLGLDDHVGSLEEGKLADLVVLDKNPLENIRDTDKIRYVMVNGRMYDALTMDQVGNEPKPRSPYFWEKQGSMVPTTTEAISGAATCAHGTCQH